MMVGLFLICFGLGGHFFDKVFVFLDHVVKTGLERLKLCLQGKDCWVVDQRCGDRSMIRRNRIGVSV